MKRSDIENSEIVGRHECAAYLFSFSGPSEAEGVVTSNRHRGERAILFLPVAEIWIGNRPRFKVSFALVQRYQLLRIRIGQWIEQVLR